MTRHRRWVLALVSMVGCTPYEIREKADIADCSLDGQLEIVETLMHDDYLWASEVPYIDRLGYSDPAQYMEDLRYAPLDKWSYVMDLAEAEDWYGSGSYVGGGYIVRADRQGRRRVLWVYPGLPAAEAGLQRGDIIVGVNGVPVGAMTSDADWAAAIGDIREGAIVRFQVQRPGRQLARVEFRLAEISLPSVVGARVFPHGDRTVGYLMFTTFVETGADELRALFASFQGQGVDTVIVDLRYNGGGLNSVAQTFASLLAPSAAGEVYERFWYNDANASSNMAIELEDLPEAIDVRDVVFLTTNLTASASEMLGFGLEPYVLVWRIGQTTAGKPVGMNFTSACELFLAPVTFQAGNRDFRAEYYEGIVPDCVASDRWTTDPGADDDPMMVGALAQLDGLPCPSDNGDVRDIVEPAGAPLAAVRSGHW